MQARKNEVLVATRSVPIVAARDGLLPPQAASVLRVAPEGDACAGGAGARSRRFELGDRRSRAVRRSRVSLRLRFARYGTGRERDRRCHPRAHAIVTPGLSSVAPVRVPRQPDRAESVSAGRARAGSGRFPTVGCSLPPAACAARSGYRRRFRTPRRPPSAPAAAGSLDHRTRAAAAGRRAARGVAPPARAGRAGCMAVASPRPCATPHRTCTHSRSNSPARRHADRAGREPLERKPESPPAGAGPAPASLLHPYALRAKC